MRGVNERMFPKVLAALEGKSTGDEVRVTLNPEEGFGQPDPNLIITDDLENAPQEFRRVGACPTFQNDQGDAMEMVVTKIENGKITIDGNHPFADKTVTFLLTAVGVTEPDDTAHLEEIITTPGPSTLQ